MKRGSTVELIEDDSGKKGKIIEISRGSANVYWDSGKLYWVDISKIREVNESR